MPQRKGKKPGPKSATDRKRNAALKKARAVKAAKQDGEGIRDFFRGVKTGYKTVEKVGQVQKAYEDAAKNKPPPLPPKPAHLKAPAVSQPAPNLNPVSINDALKKHKFLGKIDSFLGDIGARDFVRSKLANHAIGKHVLTGADHLIQQGYGLDDIIRVN